MLYFKQMVKNNLYIYKKIMPESKSRHPHKHAHPQHQNKNADVQTTPKNQNRVVTVAVIFFTVIGLSIGFFIDATNVIVLLTGAVLGGFTGFFAGQQLKKSLSGK
jgi:hypothetical protein